MPQLVSWGLLAAWVCVIWGHSLIPGTQSSMESSLVLEVVQKAGMWLVGQDFPPITRLLAEHPGIINVLNDSSLLHHYVRKSGHFCEYFMLAILAFNAVRTTFAHPVVSALVLGGIWCAVPNIDETIQRFVPGRAGMTTDVLLDMCGFACGFVLCLLCAGIARLFRRDPKP
jgi:VanZ family protein